MTAVKNPIEKKNKKPINWIRVAFILFSILLPWVFFLVFYVYVNIDSIFMAFQTSDGAWTVDHFVRAFKEFTSPDGELLIALKNTLITFAIGLVTYPFKVLVSYFLYKKIPFAGVYRILFFLPAMIFGVAIAMVFTQFVGVYGPIAKQIGEWMGLSYIPELLADSRFANYTLWAHMLWLGFPGDLIIWGGTFARIPADVLESGQIDGVSWLGEFTKIVVPLVWPTVALQLLLSFCGIFGASTANFLLTGGAYGTQTLSTWLYMQTLAGAGDPNAPVFNYMSAVGLIMTVIAVTITMFMRKYTNKMFTDAEF